MFIESLELMDYRNYDTLFVDLDDGTNIFYGDNAQGKTNILESIYLCGTTKSHRGSKDREIIKFGKEEAHIRMIVNKNGITYRIDMHLKKNKSKGIAINGLPIRKAGDLFGVVNIVFFSPEDLHIIKNGPGDRRRFLDLELCQLDKIYLTDLYQYHRVLNQRNKLLKDIFSMPDLSDTMDVWDEQLVHYGNRIMKARENFIEELKGISSDIHKNLTGEKERLEILYEPSVTEQNFIQILKRNREKDIRFKMTSAGPHRDDFCVKINDIDIRKYGSQGQQRTAALSLKLSEIYMVKKRIKDTPVLLLDDVLSELDSSRQNYLLNHIKDIQTLITCTGLDDFVNNRFQIDRMFKVIDGNVYHSN